MLLYGFAVTLPLKTNDQETLMSITEKGMKVSWTHEKSFVRFELSAPTNGWVAIGFNEKTGLTDTYLIMARIRDGFAEVTEHRVFKPGHYVPVMELDGKPMIFDCAGIEADGKTIVSFSVPTGLGGEYQKDLSPNLDYYLTMAFSQSDDFQHHSIMRTQQKVKL